MMPRKLVGVMGSGLIGTDPYAENAWSGSSRFFFGECGRQGMLHRAFGVEAPPARRIPLMLRNFSPDRSLWRQKFYLDTGYYRLLSRLIGSSLQGADHECDVLQIGGIYHLRPLLRPTTRLFSYHDANLAQAIHSPHFPRNISKRRVQRAFDYERRVYDDIDMIFTMSDYLRGMFIEHFGVEPARVTTIGAGINLTSLPELPTAKRYDTQRLLFIGADFERKGGVQLLQAFKQVRAVHPAAELTIVGPRQLTIPAQYSAGVVYLGFLSKTNTEQMRRFREVLEGASLFVLPSLYEPFGIAPLEAMAHGIPAVLTDDWAFPEMVAPGRTGALVPAGNVQALAEQLIGLLRDPDGLRSMGAAGRALVEEKFTWSAVVRRLRKELTSTDQPNR